jgi:hypothetical protein
MTFVVVKMENRVDISGEVKSELFIGMSLFLYSKFLLRLLWNISADFAR